MMSVLTSSPDYTAIKQRQQSTWATGNYAVVGTTLQIVGETLCETADISAGDRVLDVAAGNGNATLAAARRFADVTSTDYVEQLLELGKARAAADGLSVTFKVADAEALPFGDGAFDAVLSTFGVMFAPNQEQAAHELIRVIRKGGKVCLANWTSEGFIGQLFKTIGRHAPPPQGVKSPALWGTEERLKELFAGHRITVKKQVFTFRYRSAQHWLDIFRTYYGPVNRAFAALDQKGQATLERDIMDLITSFNMPGRDTLAVPSEYLEAVIVKA
jgi:ubiquinone/menaquinone biosynthesis C-methylase UbiE